MRIVVDLRCQGYAHCVPLAPDEPDTWGPPEADCLAADLGGWHDPAASVSRADTQHTS